MKGGMQFTFTLILVSFLRHAAGNATGYSSIDTLDYGAVSGVGGAAGSNMGGAVGSNVGGAVGGSRRYSTGGAVRSSLKYSTGGAVGSSLRYSTGGAVGRSSRYSTGRAVGSASRYSTGGTVGRARRYNTGAAGGIRYPNTKLLGMTGFARKGGTQGGAEGKVYFIRNLEELKTQVRNAMPQSLIIVANIYAPKKETIFLGSNKSIIGSYQGNVLNNVYFHTAKNSSNIIFQNLYFKHDPRNIDNSDTQLILEFGIRYWVDHCTFDGGNVDVNDLGKLVAVEAVNYVTVSHCKFLHHNYGLILGYPKDNPTRTAQYKNLPQLTMMFNYFNDINARAPGLMRYGKFHVYNNYIQHCRIGFTISSEARIFSEKNVFVEPRKGAEVIDDKGSGFFKDSGSVDVPRPVWSKKDQWRPAREYYYKAQTTEYTRRFCRLYAGAQRRKLNFAITNKASRHMKNFYRKL